MSAWYWMGGVGVGGRGGSKGFGVGSQRSWSNGLLEGKSNLRFRYAERTVILKLLLLNHFLTKKIMFRTL